MKEAYKKIDNHLHCLSEYEVILLDNNLLDISVPEDRKMWYLWFRELKLAHGLQFFYVLLIFEIIFKVELLAELFLVKLMNIDKFNASNYVLWRMEVGSLLKYWKYGIYGYFSITVNIVTNNFLAIYPKY